MLWAYLHLIPLNYNYFHYHHDLCFHCELFGTGKESAPKNLGVYKFFVPYEKRSRNRHRLLTALAKGHVSEYALQSVKSLVITGWVDIGDEIRHRMQQIPMLWPL